MEKAVAPDRRASAVTRIDRALTVPPLRSNTEASLVATLCLIFKLTPAEGRALVKLLKYDHTTKAEIHAAIADDDNPPTGARIVSVVIYQIRRKLARHNVQISTIWRLGFRLDKNSRDIIRKLVAEYGEDVVAAATPPGQPRPKPEALEPDMDPTTS